MIIGVSVVVASIIRVTQVAPVAELSFITELAVYEFLVVLASLVAMTVIFEAEDRGSSHRIFQYLYAAFITSGFIALMAMKKFPSSKSTVLKKITDYCVSERDYPFPAVEIDDGTKAAVDTFSVIFWPSYIGGIILLSILAWYLRDQLARLEVWMISQYQRFCQLIHVRPRRTAGIITTIFFGGYWGTACVFLYIFLQQTRQELQAAIGLAYQDSEWGFGQVAAVLVWLPLVEESIVSTWSACPYLVRRSKAICADNHSRSHACLS